MLSPYSTNEYDPNNKNTTWYKIVTMVPEGSSVLDVGCSTGTLGSVLKAEKKAKVTGIDINADDIAVASRVLDKAFVYDVDASPLDRKKFTTYDVIIFADVLEHMKDASAVLERIKPLLKPEGRVVFSIPNMAHMYVRLQLLEGSFRYTETGLLDYTHLHFYDANEVNRIFADAGYTIKKYDSTTFDYPKELLRERLNNIGLTPNKSFFELASKKDAVIFEYVGWAQQVQGVKKSHHARVGTSSPLNDVLSYVQRVKETEASVQKDLKVKIKASQKHIEKLEAINSELHSKNEALQKQVDRLSLRPVRDLIKKGVSKKKD